MSALVQVRGIFRIPSDIFGKMEISSGQQVHNFPLINCRHLKFRSVKHKHEPTIKATIKSGFKNVFPENFLQVIIETSVLEWLSKHQWWGLFFSKVLLFQRILLTPLDFRHSNILDIQTTFK